MSLEEITKPAAKLRPIAAPKVFRVNEAVPSRLFADNDAPKFLKKST